MLHVDGKLNVIADSDFRHARHGAAVRIGQRYLVFTRAVQLIEQRLVAVTLSLDSGDLLGKVLGSLSVAAAGILFLCIANVEPLHVLCQSFVRLANELCKRRPREVAFLVVYRLDAGAVDRHQFPAEQIELAAQDDELPEHLPESDMVDPAEVGDGFVIRLQVPQQPDHFDVAVRLGFQPTARSHSIQISIQVKLQKIGRIVTGTTRSLWLHAYKSGSLQIQLVDEGFNEPDRVVRPDVIVHYFRQKQHLRPVCS
ncbi:hypothetical protein D3C80_1329330 [compost metagenome]